MNPLPLSTISSMSNTALIAGDASRMVETISHDTRQMKKGALYVAIKGERIDGNHYIREASLKGAVGAICDGEIPSGLDPSFGVLKTSDSLKTLVALASSWREKLLLRSIMLTGSSGKTTTKDFTTAVLRMSQRVTSTQGNFNNHIGLPLSILSASTSDQVAVWEIGMNHRGEIAPLAALGRPDIGIITNIGTAHIGFLGSQEAIAEEKGDLFAALHEDGVAILPAADPFFSQLVKRTSARIVSVGIGCGDLCAEKIISTAIGSEFQVHYKGVSHNAFLPVLGQHMINNALLALAVGIECGVLLEDGIKALREVKSPQGRLTQRQLGGITLLDDSYNANPESMEAALATIVSLPIKGRRIAVLGRMGELGEHEKEGYQRVGKAAKGLDILITVGSKTAELARVARLQGVSEVHEVAGNTDAVKLLLTLIHSGDFILVKGSNHSARLGEVVAQLEESLSTSNA